jgi:hypothetical protein
MSNSLWGKKGHISNAIYIAIMQNKQVSNRLQEISPLSSDENKADALVIKDKLNKMYFTNSISFQYVHDTWKRLNDKQCVKEVKISAFYHREEYCRKCIYVSVRFIIIETWHA